MDVRVSSRGLVLDRADRVLLLEYENQHPVDPRRPDVLRYWHTPGGGQEPGESLCQTLRRELREELGLTEVDIGQRVAVRIVDLVLPGRGPIRSEEHYFAVRTAQVDVDMQRLSNAEREVFRDVRWWAVADLNIEPGVVFTPPALAGLAEAARDPGPVDLRILHE